MSMFIKQSHYIAQFSDEIIVKLGLKVVSGAICQLMWAMPILPL